MKTEDCIAVMQAHLRGEVIECRTANLNDKWGIIECPSWNWVNVEYRIKPREPREFLLLKASNGAMAVGSYADFLNFTSRDVIPPDAILVREIIQNEHAPRKPRECWTVFPQHSTFARITGATSAELARQCVVAPGDEIVHMREVIE